MAERTNISWADDTFNPWEGCQKTGSPACEGCYAEARNLRYAPKGSTEAPNWGPHAPRRRTSASNWAKPLKWEKEQAALVAGFEAADRGLYPNPPLPRFVFCASLADVFDNAVPPSWRADLFDLIRATPHLTWLLLTKRPQNIVRLYREAMGNPLPEQQRGAAWPPNAAIGCTVVTQAEADRDIPHLLRAKAALKPAFAFLSMEPLMAAVDVRPWLPGEDGCVGCDDGEGLSRNRCSYPDIPRDEQCPRNFSVYEYPEGARDQHGVPLWIAEKKIVLDWIITGGETDQGAHKARPTPLDAFRSVRDQCEGAGVVYHHKQNGEWVSATEIGFYGHERKPFVDFPPHRMMKVGKKLAGRTLDGVIHDARPEVAFER